MSLIILNATHTYFSILIYYIFKWYHTTQHYNFLTSVDARIIPDNKIAHFLKSERFNRKKESLLQIFVTYILKKKPIKSFAMGS